MLTPAQVLANHDAERPLFPPPGSTGVETINVGTPVETAMRDVNASAFVRAQFNVADPTVYNQLTLRTAMTTGSWRF